MGKFSDICDICDIYDIYDICDIYGIISPQLHLFKLLRYLVQAAVCVRCLALPLESHNHKAHEDVDHEEGKDDDVDHVEEEDISPVVKDGSFVLCI